MSNDEVQRFLDAEYERAKIALEQAKANLERIERARFSYVVPAEEPTKVRAARVIPHLFAGGKRLTREEFRRELKSLGWRAKFENREFTKLVNANLAAGGLAFDGQHYYRPDDAERERILRDGRKKKKR
jgi:hypothetical protein